jgi:hypothetical protein
VACQQTKAKLWVRFQTSNYRFFDSSHCGVII